MRIDDTISLLQEFRGHVDTSHERVYEEAKQLAEFISSIEEKPCTVRAGCNRSIAPMYQLSLFLNTSREV